MRWAIELCPFCENYVKLYFDAKQRLNKGGEILGPLFLKKVIFLANIKRGPNFLY